MYMDEKLTELSMRELSYFFSIQKSGIGYFHLVAWRVHMSLGFNAGRISHIKGWKEKFFYVFDTERQPIIFHKKTGKLYCIILFVLSPRQLLAPQLLIKVYILTLFQLL